MSRRRLLWWAIYVAAWGVIAVAAWPLDPLRFVCLFLAAGVASVSMAAIVRGDR